MRRFTQGSLHLAFPTIAVVALTLLAQAQSSAVGTWSGVQILEPTMVSSSPPDVPVVACDPLGHAVAAWTSPAMGVAFSEHDPGASWTAAVSILPAGTTGFSPQIAIGSSGVVAVSWIVPGQEFIPQKFVVSVRPVGGAFSTPATLVSGAYVFDSRLGVADNGSVTVLWGQGGAVKTAMRNPQGVWTPSIVLNPPNTSASLPDLVVNGAGAALAVWQETPVGGGGPSAIGVSYRAAPSRSRWGVAHAISSGLGLATWNPKPGIDDAGNAAFGYLDGNRMMVARKAAAGTWGAPQAVSPPGDNAYYPAFSMDARGNILAAWQKLDAGNYGTVSKRVLPAAGAWGPVTVLSTPDQDASWPIASVARDGSVAAVTWTDNNTFAAHADVGPMRGSSTVFTIGSCWWNTTMPIAAGSLAVSAVWPAPTTNPNVTRMVANVYTP
ncbi:MAG: hypothetical protein NTY35_02435 [Planctomycetota bacterium]|nr:hypothetical protein [Planctomycetota bacterium]